MWTVGVNTLSILFSLLLGIQEAGFSDGFSERVWNWGWIILGFQILYTAASVRIVDVDELGLILFFGRPLFNVESGPVYVPFGFCSLETEVKNVIEVELPGNPEELYYGEEKNFAVEGSGKKLPFRVNFSEAGEKTTFSIKDSGGAEIETVEISPSDPLRRKITVQVQFAVRVRITDLRTFIQTLGSRVELIVQLTDICTGSANRELAKYPFCVIQARMGTFSKLIADEVRTRVGEPGTPGYWGVSVETVQLKEFVLSHQLNTIIQGVPQAEAEANATRTRAEAERFRLQKEGEGVRDGVRASGLSPEVFAAVQVAPKITKDSNATIIAGSGGFADLIGTVIGIGESFKKTDKKKEEEETK